MIEGRLLRWAQWLKEGDGDGFPAMCVLHPEWQPPSPVTTPTLKTAPHNDARETHAAIGRLSLRMRNTLVVHYVLNLSRRDQAERLECSESTVVTRIVQAHRLLLAEFCNKFEAG